MPPRTPDTPPERTEHIIDAPPPPSTLCVFPLPSNAAHAFRAPPPSILGRMWGAIRKTHFTLRTSTSTPMQDCHDHGGARRGRGEREERTFVGGAGWMVRRGDISSLPTASREEEATIVGWVGEWVGGGA